MKKADGTINQLSIKFDIYLNVHQVPLIKE